ncbi:MAG: hypothetical protein ACQEVA_03910 [Myxococcota bacterium]
MAVEPNESRIYLARTLTWLSGSSNEYSLNILRRNEGGSWGGPPSDYAIPAGTYKTKAVPELTWQPYDQDDDPNGPGYWYLAYRWDEGWEVVTLGAEVEKTGLWGNRFSVEPLDVLYAPENDHLVGFYGRGRDAYFLPFADGMFERQVQDHNDFSAMSDSICYGFRERIAGDDRPCGPLNAIQSYYTGKCEGY